MRNWGFRIAIFALLPPFAAVAGWRIAGASGSRGGVVRRRAILGKRTILAAVVLGTAVVAGVGAAQAQERPNILWLSSEDNGPALGAYGDAYADTPNLDRLAGRGTVYLNAWSNAPVCAPARTAIITGMYPPAVGAHHMRSRVRLRTAAPPAGSLTVRFRPNDPTHTVPSEINIPAES